MRRFFQSNQNLCNSHSNHSNSNSNNYSDFIRWRTTLFAIALFMLPSAWANTQMPITQQIAKQYMQALTAQDYQTLDKFYSRDSIYFDKTAGKKLVGGNAILLFLQRSQQGNIDYRFDVDHMYNSGNLVVMIGSYYLKADGEQFGRPGKIIEVAVSGVTTIDVDTLAHRVREHTNFIDYQTLSDQLASF